MTSGMLEAQSSGVRLAGESLGDGPPALLIQGLGYGRWGWEPVTGPLARDFRVLTFDNRGIGDSDTPPGPYTVRDLADDAAAVLDAFDVERAHVVGTSLGGMVAQELALSRPGRVERLVLACTTPGGAASYPMPQQTVELIQAASQVEPVVALRRFVENALAPGVPLDRPQLVERIMQLRLSHRFDVDGWRAQAAAAMSFDAGDRLGEIRAPTLVVTGTADVVVDWRNSQLLAERVPGARLELFPGCGHLFFWEEPERFAVLVKEFLR